MARVIVLGLLSLAPVLWVAAGAVAQDAEISHGGENTANGRSSSDTHGGDAVGGANYVGAAGTGDATITARNESRDATAETGKISGSNRIERISVGEQVPLAVVPKGFAAPVRSIKDGDNRFRFVQSYGIDQGDAVAGTNVTGTVRVGTVRIDTTNRSRGDTATGGNIDESNALAVVTVGGVVVGPTGPTGPTG